MAAELQETTFAHGVESALAALDRDGAVIVHDFLAPPLLERFHDDMREVARHRHLGSVDPNPATRTFWGARTMRFTRLATRSPAFFDILTHPGFVEVTDRVLLPNCASYWMNTAQMMILAPGQSAQELHRDADNWWRVSRPDGIELTISCLFAIEDFTADNGATVVIPGSHRWDDFDRVPAPDDHTTQAVMPAGSGLLYTGRVLHGGGANTTDAWRWGLHISFVVGWLMPEEASPLGIPWEVVRDQPERVQRLLGWRSTAPTSGGGRLWTVDYEDVPTGLGLI